MTAREAVEERLRAIAALIEHIERVVYRDKTGLRLGNAVPHFTDAKLAVLSLLADASPTQETIEKAAQIADKMSDMHVVARVLPSCESPITVAMVCREIAAAIRKLAVVDASPQGAPPRKSIPCECGKPRYHTDACAEVDGWVAAPAAGSREEGFWGRACARLLARNKQLSDALRRAHACATIRDDGSCDGCFVSEALAPASDEPQART